ncbi:general substrate transporter [Mycena vulgaris]|nr:general substrate transporter [Mycena vulgaris]
MALRSRIARALKPTTYTVRYPRRMAGKPLLYISSASASLGDALLGYSQGITAVFQIQPSFIQCIYGVTVTSEQIKNGTTGIDPRLPAIMDVCLSIAALFSALGSAYASDHLGRRISIRVGAVLYLIASCIQMIAPNFATLVVGRSIQGLGAGILSTTVPVFQVEIAPADARGALAGLEAFCMNAGYAASAWVGYAFFAHAAGEHTWRGPYGVQATAALALILLSFVLPESPRWLVQNGFKSEGLWTLADLHAGGDVTDARVNHTYYAIVDALEMEGRVARWRDFRAIPRRTLIGLLARMLAQLNGIGPVLHALPEHLAQAGLAAPRALLAAGCCAILYSLGPLPAILFIDRLGRRRFLLAGSIALALTLVATGTLELLSTRVPQLGGARAVGAGLGAYLFFFGATWGPVPWLLSAELFPFRMRARGMALTSAADWLVDGAVGLAAPPLFAVLGAAHFYFLLAGACVLSGCVVWAVFVETGGQPLEAIGGVFGDAMPPARRIEQEDEVLKLTAVASVAGTSVGSRAGTSLGSRAGTSQVTLHPDAAASTDAGRATGTDLEKGKDA